MAGICFSIDNDMLWYESIFSVRMVFFISRCTYISFMDLSDIRVELHI